METLALLADGFSIALTPQNLFLAVVGCFLGTLMGALPGLGPANGVAILIPIAFSLGLGPIPSLILLTSVYYGAMEKIGFEKADLMRSSVEDAMEAQADAKEEFRELDSCRWLDRRRSALEISPISCSHSANKSSDTSSTSPMRSVTRCASDSASS